MNGRADPDSGSSTRRARITLVVAAAVLLLLYPSCSFDGSGIAPAIRDFECTVEVWHCPTTAGSVDLYVAAAGGHPQVAAYRVVTGLGSDHGTVYGPYHDKGVAFITIGSDALKGSSLVQTSGRDWSIDTPSFLEVALLTDAEALYVAFDSRVPPPDWLAGGYAKQPEVLTLSRRDPAATTPTYLTMDLWRLNGERAAGERIFIPGASFGTDWSAVKTGKPLMYTVLVQPTATVNCAAGTRLAPFVYEECVSIVEDEEQRALAACRAANPSLQCVAPSCRPGELCPGTNTVYGVMGIKAYRVGSRVEFLALSTIDVSIAGEPRSADVEGELHFSHDGDLTRLIIDDVKLYAETIQTDEGPFEDTTLVLWSPAEAECRGEPSGYEQPCDAYRIAPGGLRVTVSTHFDDEDLLWLGENTQDIDVAIDHTSRTFRFAGRLTVSMIVNDEPVDLEADLELNGLIANVAPEAVGTLESDPAADCIEDRNHQEIVLNAAGSFDVYSPSPTNLPSYEWYEDFGLATQHHWGNGFQVVIPSGALGFGTHQITLLVADQDGTVDTDTFDVAVVDDTPPEFSALPQDITTDVYPAGTESVFVDLGEASASDTCSAHVEVSHDGPEDGMFAPGSHTVTWTADDERGNTTTASQRVEVRTLASSFPWSWVILPGAGLLAVIGGALALRRLRRRPGKGAAAGPRPPGPPRSALPWGVATAVAMAVAVGLTALIVVLVTRDDQGEAAATTVAAPTTTAGAAAPAATTTTATDTTAAVASTTTAPTPATSTTSTAPTSTTTTAPPPLASTTTTATTTTTTTTTTLPGPVLDPDAEPRYGSHKLVSGFLGDPAAHAIYAGGPVDVEPMPQIACNGWAAPNPDLRLDWAGEGTLLRFYFTPDDPGLPGSDTVLIVSDPSGTWHCADDSYGTVHPTVDFGASQRGFYDIWVATYAQADPVPGTLYITEFDANHP